MLTSDIPKAELFQPENLSEMTMEKMLDKMEENYKLALSLIFDKIDEIQNMCQLCRDTQNKNQELQEEVNYFKLDNRNKDERIKELECLAHPESLNGDAIGNYNWLD
ncbi:hypothetical protein [Okeania sp.]|uniref:hypothetical protein n=1 Tax=Okeania sp. TaxID=3100323 RepID=UPI002B4B2145|nr:hypothetical protein [Okeania sp.]MEB3339626.1 hypothetical protein [Okeania sp.]